MPRVKSAPTADAPQVIINTVPQQQTEEKPPAKEKPNFWALIKQMPAADWNHHTIYLYRLKPVVGMKSKERYLDVFAQPFTPEDVKQKFGGEEFRAMLVGKNGQIIANEEFAVEAPAKYDAAREIPLGNVGAPTNGGGPGDAVTKKVVDQFLDERRSENDLFINAHNKTLELVTDGYKQVAQAAAEASASRPNGKTDDNDLVKVLLLKLLDRNPMKDLMESLALARELGLIPKTAEAANPVSVLGQVKEVLGLVKELGGEMGGGRGRAASITETIMEHAPGLIEKGVDALGKYAEIKAQENENLKIRANAATRIAAINRGAQPPAAQSDIPQAMPGGAPRAASAVGAGIAAGASAGANAGAGGLDLEPVAGGPIYPAVDPAQHVAQVTPMPRTEADANDFLFTFFKARVVQLIAEGERTGAEIVDFAEDYDPRIYEMLDNTDAAGLRGFFASDPILRPAMALPQFETRFAEICAALEYAGPMPIDAGPAKPN
jgi:hypothetical protein